MRFLTDHWELKVVAVVVAVALYIYTSGQVRVERTVALAVNDGAVHGLPAEFQVTAIEPREFKVQLSVPVSRLDDLDFANLAPRLEVGPDQLTSGVATFPLTSQCLRLPNDVRIISTEPADLRELTVHLDRIAQAELPVEPPRLVGLPPGLEAQVEIHPTMVQVRAPAPVLERLAQDKHRVRFQEVALGHVPPSLAGELQETVVLIPLPAPAEFPYAVVGRVDAEVRIHPLPGVVKSLPVPVQVLADAELLRAVRVELAQPRLVLELRGPENLLRELNPDRDLIAWVAVGSSLEAGVQHQLPVEVRCPPGLVLDRPAGEVGVVLVPLPAEKR